MRTESQFNCARRQRSTLRGGGRTLPAQTRQFGQCPRGCEWPDWRYNAPQTAQPWTLPRRALDAEDSYATSSHSRRRAHRSHRQGDLRRRFSGLADGGRWTGTEQCSARHRRDWHTLAPPGRTISGCARTHSRSAGRPPSTAPAGPAAERLARRGRREQGRGQCGPAVGPGVADLQGMLTGDASAIIAVMQIRDVRSCAGAPSRDAVEHRPVSHVVRMLILAIACHGEFCVKTRK